MTLTFVVGTGRCGSTLLSRLLQKHPDVLSISEFFSVLKTAVQRWDFPTGEMNGQELWALLATPVPIADAIVRDLGEQPDWGYPYATGRFGVESGVPVVCHQMLPLLTSDPDALFDQLAAEVPAWPRRPAADQYRALFAFLASSFGRRVVVERSGASLLLVSLLHEQFPDARLVHMHRDGPDCALSMSRHPGFRRETIVVQALQATQAAGLSPASLAEVSAAAPAEFDGLITPPIDAERLWAHPVPLTFVAELWWTSMVCQGAAKLSQLPPDTWISLKYEDLLSAPERELTRLAGFMGVPAAPRWLDTARQLIDPGKAGTAQAQLDPDTLTSLRAACAPGTQAIAALDRHHPTAT